MLLLRWTLSLVDVRVISLVHTHSLDLLLVIDWSYTSVTHIRLKLHITKLCIVSNVLEHDLPLCIPSTFII